MEYIEMPATPKGMFDKIISNDGLRVPFSANGPGAAGFRPMPIPVFSHGKSLAPVGMAPVPPPGSGSELPRRGGMPSFVTSGMSLNGTHMALVNGGNGGLGMMHLQVPGESGSSHQGDELLEKGKRSRAEGGKGTRGGGTSSRKRTRAVQADSLTTSEAMPDGSLSGGAAASGGRAAAVNGTRQLQNSNGDKAEKSLGRRQNGQGTKRGDKKQSQTVATSVNEALPQKAFEANGAPNGWSNGILDIYGLQTRSMDVSRFMVDIPLNDLLSGNFEAPTFSLKDNDDTKMEPEEGFERQLDSVFHLLLKRPAMAEAPSLKINHLSGNLGPPKGLKNPKMILDLERPLQVEEDDGVSRTEKETKSDVASATDFEAGDDRDTGLGSTAALPNGLAPLKPPSRSLLGWPVHSVENFQSRLKLNLSDPLHSLIAQAAADGEMSGSADKCTGVDIVDSCHRNGSVPPLLFSYPHVGPVKAGNGRYNHRIWVRAPTAENSGGKGGSGFTGKEGSNGAEEDASNSPSLRQRKSDGKDKIQSPDGMHVSTSGTHSLAPGQMGPSKILTVVDSMTSIKDEPRQVENAVGFSSEGNVNPMEIDSGRVDNGSVPSSGADGAESAQVNLDSDLQRGGEAVRPLETPSTLGGPQEMDSSSDRQAKLVASTLAEVKQEKAEQQAAKDPVEEASGEANLVPVASKQGMSLGVPAPDLKINVRSSSPPQNDSSSSLPVCPSSPGAQAAARILCSMANSANHPDQDKVDGDKERRRRFQPYPGAPVQKTTKSIRVNNPAVVPGDGGHEGRRSADGGAVPPSKALVSERRKSLSQVNDGSDKPSYSSPRNSSGGGISTGSRGGTHTGSRSNSLSVKLEKVAAREPTKDSTSMKEFIGRGSSSLPPLSHGGPPLKNGHKGGKTNNYLHSSNSKGSVPAANFSKVPAACTTQRVVSGGTSSRSSRTVHTGNSLASHGPAPVPFKSSRQSTPESRQKTKSELSGRGGKPSRD